MARRTVIAQRTVNGRVQMLVPSHVSRLLLEVEPQAVVGLLEAAEELRAQRGQIELPGEQPQGIARIDAITDQLAAMGVVRQRSDVSELGKHRVTATHMAVTSGHITVIEAAEMLNAWGITA